MNASGWTDGPSYGEWRLQDASKKVTSMPTFSIELATFSDGGGEVIRVENLRVLVLEIIGVTESGAAEQRQADEQKNLLRRHF